MRRQVLLPFCKPAIVITPKSLLRHPLARSKIEEFFTSFRCVICEEGKASEDPNKVERLIFFYYDILAERQKENLDETIALVEQISP